MPTKEVRSKAKSQVIVPADQSRRLIETMDRLGHLALAAILVIGTLFGASLANMSPTTTAIVVVVELIFIFVLSLFRRTSRRK